MTKRTIIISAMAALGAVAIAGTAMASRVGGDDVATPDASDR